MDVKNTMIPVLPETLPKKTGQADAPPRSDSQQPAHDARLRKACADFEGILLQYMFESLQKTVGSGGVFGDSHQKKMYESMVSQEVSAKLARERGVGIGEALYRQIAGRTMDEPQAASDGDEKVS